MRLLRRPRETASPDALLRVAGAPLVEGNGVRVLKDAVENYRAWEEAIAAARATIHVEMYLFKDDPVGRRFRDLLVDRARSGVAVRLLYDWVGCGPGAGRLFRPLRAAGGEVRAANPLALDRILGQTSRDHRKLITVDSRVAFVSGLCIAQAWEGDPARGIPGWRDTGVRIEGPAVADAEAAFGVSWALAGPPLATGTLPRRETMAPAGDVALRVIASLPETTGLYRLDLLVSVAAQRTLFLTDAYFMGTTVYRHALASAARCGVDVRLLVPHSSDIEWIARFSRTTYRPLLKAGVRIYEWNGPMVHAKTAVADGRWTRIGSTNLNVASWLGNWELDVSIENERIGREMEEMFLEDLENATEVVLGQRNRVVLCSGEPGFVGPGQSKRRRALASAAHAGSVLGAAVKGYRTLEPAEAGSLAVFAVAALALAGVSVLFPEVIAYPVAALVGTTGGLLLIRAVRLWSAGRRARRLPAAPQAPQ